MGISMPGVVQVLITGALLLHAVAHAIAFVGLIGQASAGKPHRKAAVGSWLFPALAPKKAALFLLPFWLLAMVLLFTAAASSWGVLIPGPFWGRLAVFGAGISILGSLLSGGIWPGSPNTNRAYLNTSVAVVMNFLILTAMVWLQWLPSRWIIG